jgi:hypothetical protein
MKRSIARIVLLGAALAVTAVAPDRAHAQQPQQSPIPHRQVISANPFGLLLELFNAEYERIVSESSTAGFGGSTFSTDDDRYVNADVFWRFCPSGVPLDGWAFGAKLGITSVTDQGTYLGYGFDVNRSWLLGMNNNFYVGVGFGLKRLVGASGQDFDLRFIPTFRLVNIGIAF